MRMEVSILGKRPNSGYISGDECPRLTFVPSSPDSVLIRLYDKECEVEFAELVSVVDSFRAAMETFAEFKESEKWDV